MAMVIVPLCLFHFVKIEWNLFPSSPILFQIAGLALFLIGISIFIQSVVLFIKIGNGTLAPWNPTKKLVVKSLYRHTRNPMISGVLLILIAESLVFQSMVILIWAAVFFIINTLYFIMSEEPKLQEKFGDEYREYCENVPRWVPNWQGWRPENQP